ncbi:hypothetical protein LOZ80_19540 [Paenibacillus sp. HWE-109]|uniref:hypothetical protein n=1 Tax=Paenibacillus sp. HWE-109 TaxID=1306526 RepID=UPI001EDD7D8B|nr:hypothetical protein [Paenibacillus sp. HWE-109]UKS23841.1 hypothetical protein LOZ80_19540 [Paenibacillus sp. HWE-109]
MIWFILFGSLALIISVIIMIQTRRKTKEIIVFAAISLLGFADWISILMDRKFKSTKLIGLIIDTISFWN